MMLNTILEERFKMAHVIMSANTAIEDSRSECEDLRHQLNE